MKGKKVNREILLRLISLCEMVEKRGINPFEVEVAEALNQIRQMLPKWKSFDEYCLDAETINKLSKVVKLQEEWVKHRSSTLYSDPEIIRSKLMELEAKTLAQIFLKAWHPVISIEKLSAKKLKEALTYWENLSEERFKLEKAPFQEEGLPELASKDELLKLKIFVEEEFNRLLEKFWFELLDKAKGKEKISYWDFVFSDNYEDFVVRSYLTSFLVSYGYAEILVKPMEDEIFLIPKLKPEKPTQTASTSLTIPINYARWLKLKKERKK